MIAVARQKRKQAILNRALSRRITKPAPRLVLTWAQDHLRLPDSDMRRMKKLYDKVMKETITERENAELDSLIDACAAMDLLRARMVFGVAKGVGRSGGK
jgi:hypothetical protein